LYFDNEFLFNTNVAQFRPLCFITAHLVKVLLIITLTPRCRSTNWYILRSRSSNVLCFYLYRLDMPEVQHEIRNVSVLKLSGDLCGYDCSSLS
jgi:hypothetical protein